MQIYVSNRELQSITQGLVQAVHGKSPPRRVNVDAVARYLHLPVRYERFAEADQDKLGFAADGIHPLSIWVNGERQAVTFPRNTIVLDRFFLQPEEQTRRRFALAHEIGHILLWRADPMHQAARFHSLYDPSRDYSIAELHERLNLEECQANFAGAALLMPRESLADAVKRHLRREQVPIYGDGVFLPSMKPAIQAMAVELGVSHTALVIQLRTYKLVQRRDMEEYIQIVLEEKKDEMCTNTAPV